MDNPIVGTSAQRGDTSDPNGPNITFNKDLLSDQIFNKKANAGIIARNILLANKSPSLQRRHKPNLKHSRSRSASQSSQASEDGATDLEDSNFKRPRKTVKLHSVPNKQNVNTDNQFMVLTDNDSSDELLTNDKKNSKNKNKNKNSGTKTSSAEFNNKINDQKRTTRARPPPIYAQLPGIKPTITFLLSKGILSTEFTVCEFDNIFTKIFPVNMDIYDSCINVLKTEKKQYFTYTPRHRKIKTIVLKGVRGGFDETDVKTALVNKQLAEVTITKVSKMIFDKANPQLFHFLVSASADSKLASLTRLKSLLSQPIRWERLRKPTLFMCKRCQQTGHSSTNCHLQPNCVKCAGDHESKDCSFKRAEDQNQLKCINCNEVGHPANYKGCPALKFMTMIKNKEKKIKEAKKKKVVNAISNFVNPGHTFANVMDPNSSKHFPPLPRTKPSAAGVPLISDHTIDPSSSLENILFSFKRDIMNEFKRINKNIEANTRRIDQIMSVIFTNE